jgi:hypothetical protein
MSESARGDQGRVSYRAAKLSSSQATEYSAAGLPTSRQFRSPEDWPSFPDEFDEFVQRARTITGTACRYGTPVSACVPSRCVPRRPRRVEACLSVPRELTEKTKVPGTEPGVGRSGLSG